MALLHIFIAHFIGDFILQPKSLIKKKYKSWTGTFIHAGIIGMLMALFMFPFWQHTYTWILVLIVAVTHFIQDVSKVNYLKKYKNNKSMVPFLLDQFAHLLLLFILGRNLYLLTPAELPNWISGLYFSHEFVIALLGVVIATFVLDIFEYQFKLKLKKDLKYSANSKAMLRRGLLFLGGYLMVFALVLI